MMSKKIVYLEVTNDEFELPTNIAYSLKEMSILTGKHESTISKCINHGLGTKYKNRKFIKIEVEDDE